MKTAVVVGNPKAKSRTLDAGVLVMRKLTGAEPGMVLDLVDLGAALLEFGNPKVAEHIQAVQSGDVVVFASPTFKATYTGLMKLFLDQIPSDGLAGVTALPVMLGAGPARSRSLCSSRCWSSSARSARRSGFISSTRPTPRTRGSTPGSRG